MGTSRQLQVTANLSQALKLWRPENRVFVALLRHHITPGTPAATARDIARLLRWRLPHRPSRYELTHGAEQVLRLPLAALRAGGDCDDYTLAAGLLWESFYPLAPKRIAWYPTRTNPYHVSLAVQIDHTWTAIDPLPPYPLTYPVDPQNLDAWPSANAESN